VAGSISTSTAGYEFTKAPTLINVDGIIAELAQRPIVPSEDDA
jgi:hypothetical protein